MALHFLVPDRLDAAPGDSVVLTGSEAHHAASVRRVRVGEPVTLGDGIGAWVEAVCARVDPREVVLEVVARRDVPPPPVRVHLVQALAKGDRDELAVQAATELGVDVVTPWQAERSVSRWDAAKVAKGVARWRTITREASKQSHRAWVPDITDPVTTTGLCERASRTRMLVLEPTAQTRLGVWRPEPDDTRDILLVVGPEGGISSGELEQLAEAGAILVRLGPEVLRTSTAGPAALALVAAALGRW